MSAALLVVPLPLPAQTPTASPPETLAGSEQLRFGPVPGWVVSIDPPATKSDDGALRSRLEDLQVRHDAQGTHFYLRRRIAVNAAEGLQFLSTLGLQWQPSLGGATVHFARLHRDGKMIDLLAGGSRFQVLRREDRLERERLLSGLRQAVMPIADLRVGDELEFAYSIDRLNPLLAGHFEDRNRLEPRLRPERLYHRFSAAPGTVIRLRAGKAWPKVTRTTGPEGTAYVIDALNPVVEEPLAGVPDRFNDIYWLDLSDFADWAAVRALMAPHYEEAARIGPDSPLQAEIARIAAASTDPAVRAAAALQLVQRQVRYLAQVDGLGAYKPEPADTVWTAKWGDCKGKTVLLLALLRGLGITAEPALVSTEQGDGLPDALPMPGRFNHVIVRVQIAGKSYWLDGTRQGDGGLESLEVPDFGWALPLGPQGGALVPLAATLPAKPFAETSLDFDARAGLTRPAKATGRLTLRGDSARQTRALLALADAAERDKYLRKLWTERYDFLTVDRVETAADEASGEVTLSFVGTAKLDWSPNDDRRYEADNARLGVNLAPERPAERARRAPVLVNQRFEAYRQTIMLPDGGNGYAVEGKSLDRTIGGVHYVRTAEIKGGRFEMNASTRAARSEVSFDEAKAADLLTDELYRERLFVKLPTASGKGGADRGDVAAGGVIDKASEDALAVRINALLADLKIDQALALIDGKLAEQRTARRLTMRGAVLQFADRIEEASDAYDAAIAVSPDYLHAQYSKAELLVEQGNAQDALILFDRLVLREPEKNEYYIARGQARIIVGRLDGALNDFTIVLQRDPKNQAATAGRLAVLQAQGNLNVVLAELDKPEAEPDEALRFHRKAYILALLGRTDEARAAAEKSKAAYEASNRLPEGAYYALQLQGLAPTLDARGEAMLALLRQEPAFPLELALMAPLARDARWRPQIIDGYLKAQAAVDPKLADQIKRQQGRFMALGGEPELLRQLIKEKVAANPEDSGTLNNACWDLATLNLDLDQASDYCAKAVARAPRAAYLDSRALVALQRGDLASARRDYDAALASHPNQPMVLYGRGLTRLRQGDAAGGMADLERARKFSPMIDQQYAGFGLKP